MSSNVTNQVAYLRNTRRFPEDLKELTQELNRSYIDIANAVNNRTIGIFPVNRPAQTGENWFFNQNQKQQGFRQVYTLSSFSAVNHMINTQNTGGFVKIYGTFTDGTNWYPLPYTDPTVANQVGVKVTPGMTGQIVFTVGGSAPSITKGFLILEWLSEP